MSTPYPEWLKRPVTTRATPGRWTVAGGNDEDDYPPVSVWNKPAKRSFHIYSVNNGETVAYVPFDPNEKDFERASQDAWAIVDALERTR